MDEKRGPHPIAGAPGALAVATWLGYALLAAFFYAPDIPPSAWAIGFFGLLACVAVISNFARWRIAVLLASFVHLSFYAVRIVRMVAMTPDLTLSSLLSTLSFYYGASWRVTVGMLEERGVAASLAHGFLEYAVPVLSLVLIALAWMSRPRRGVLQAG